MSISEDLKITRKRYWDLSGVKTNLSISYDNAREQFRHLLKDSVKRRLRSDVPVGSSLSGGLDSSSIVGLIHELNKEQKIKQNSFSARFKNFKRDEGAFIEMMTASVDVRSHYTWPDEEGFISDLEKLIYHQEEPFPSASIYAQYCVMKLAKSENVTVLLDGQGADELLAGYEYYLGFYLRSVFNEKPLDYPKQLEAFKSLHKHLHFNDLRERTTGKIQEAGVKEKIKGILRPAYQRINPSKYKRIAARLPLEGFFSKEFVMQFNEHIDYDFTYKGTDLNGYLRYSTTTNNLEDLLRFCDRNSMAHSREVRLPFLDHTLAEFVFSLPEEYKIHNGWTKYILRDSMKEILPPEIAWRVDKVGYEPPQAQWMKSKKVAELTNDSFQALKNKKILHRSAELRADKQWPVLVSAFLFR
jgi:asparagine synthase (glutamine-hydrolysing)